jgi:hypothetical protein
MLFYFNLTDPGQQILAGETGPELAAADELGTLRGLRGSVARFRAESRGEYGVNNEIDDPKR